MHALATIPRMTMVVLVTTIASACADSREESEALPGTLGYDAAAQGDATNADAADASLPDASGSSGAGGAGGWPGVGGDAGSEAGVGGDGGIGGTGGAGGAGGTGGTAGNGGVGGDDAGAAGQAGAGGSGPPSWKRYAYSWAAQTWSTDELADVWIGANAPPSSGINAAVQLSDMDRLLVFADDGKYYWRKNGVWQTPVSIASRWPGVPTPIRAAYHVPHAWSVSWDPEAPNEESVTLIYNPQYYSFAYRPDDTIAPQESGTAPDEPPPGPPHTSGIASWAFEVMDLSLFGEADAFLAWLQYGDQVYRMDAAGVWTSWPIAQSPMWSKPGAPPTTGLEAAYFDQSYGIAYLIGP